MTSSRLYSAVTKYWPRIAAGFIATLGVVELVLGGLTSDSSVELYITAWAATTGGVWFLFEKAERSLSQASRDAAVEYLRDTDRSDQIRSVPQHFAELFDRVFGERHDTVGCLFRSTVASAVGLAVAWLALAALGATEVRELDAFWWTGSSLFGGSFSLWFVFFVFPFFNALPDYISLLETRFALRFMLARFRLVLGIDLVLTAMIGLAGIFLHWTEWTTGTGLGFSFDGYWNPQYFLTFVAPDIVLGRSHYSPLFYSAFVTSVWLWLYAASVLLSRVLLRMNSGVGFLLRVTDVEHQPFRSMGFVSVLIVSCLFALGLPLVLL